MRVFKITNLSNVYFIKNTSKHRDTDLPACYVNYANQIKYKKNDMLHRICYPAILSARCDLYYEYGKNTQWKKI